jgi:hypothetical protein
MGLSTGIGIGISFSRGGPSYWSTRIPSGLFLIVDSTTQITLYWYNNGTVDYDDIRIERSAYGVTYAEIVTVANGTLLYVNTGLTADTTYYYRLRYRKGTNYSDYSNVASDTTFVSISALTPDIWLKAEDNTGVDLSDISTWEDAMNNHDFVLDADNSAFTLRQLPVPLVTPKANDSALHTVLSGGDAAITFFEYYFVLTPDYSNTALARMLVAYRDSATELLQLSMLTDETMIVQFRTSANSIRTITANFNAGRFNIYHVIYDKARNKVSFEIDGVNQDLAYTFGVETLRSTILTLFNYILSTVTKEASVVAPINFYASEFIAAFNTDLVTSRAKIYSYLNDKYNTYFGGYSTNKTLAEIVAATPLVADYIDRTAIYALVTAGTIRRYDIQTTDNPQTIFNNAPAGSLVRFKAGTHTHATGTNRSILYCDKPMYVELEAGAILKLADNSNTLDTAGEITTNQGTAMVLNDLSIRGTYTGASYADLKILIDTAAATDKFSWGVGVWDPAYTATGVSITGDWQALGATGIEIKFTATTGHGLNNLWIVCFDGEESYGIRVGTGFHTNYIKDVVIFGDGVIDMNYSHQIYNSVHAKNLPAGILIHGRCFDTIMEGITIQNGHRAVMVYGDNNGTYGNLGVVTGGTNFNCIGTKIINVIVLNDYEGDGYSDGYGILLGHPEHRGGSFGVICNLNDIDSYGAGIEPNLRLFNYEIRNNKVRCSSDATTDIHCWRESINGIIVNNDATAVTWINAPTGWEIAKNIYHTANARA